MFMFWMIGNSLSIWTIMMIAMFVMNPLKSLFSLNQAFKQFEAKGVSLVVPKLIYFALNLATIGLSIYKFSVMGILPVTPQDWVGLINIKTPVEQAATVWFK